MNQKMIGVIVVIIGILLSLFVYMAKAREDNYINDLISETGSCYLDDGTCLHADRGLGLYIFGGIASLGLILLGSYLILFDKTQKVLIEHQKNVSTALLEAKKDGRFHAFLSGFNQDEQNILMAVKEQDGILQSTLRYRTGMSKASLSLMLKSLEERDIVTRKKAGKTNEVFLRKRY